MYQHLYNAGPKQQMLSSQKTIIKNSNFEITLSYEKLQKNLGKLIKIHNEADNLHVLPKNNQIENQLLIQTFNNEKPIPLRRSCIQQKCVVQQSYLLNSNEAVQLIWRAAAISKELGVTPAEMKEIQRNEYIGENNKLQEQILCLEEAIFSKRNLINESEKEKVKKYIKLLRNIKNFVNQFWRNTRKLHEKIFSQLQKRPLISLIRPQLTQTQRIMILKQLQKKIISIDLCLLKQSIQFIQQLPTQSKILVVLEQPYPPFTANKEEFINFIGLQSYNQSIKNFQISKELMKERNRPFKIKDISMCHKCLELSIPNIQSQQIFICSNSKVMPDFTSTPYAYQQIVLLGNYSVIPQFYSKQKGKVEDGFSFKRFVHPYARTYSLYCNRLVCKECLTNYINYFNSKEKKKEATQKTKCQQITSGKHYQRTLRKRGRPAKKDIEEQINSKVKHKKCMHCQFCNCVCECQRCASVQYINKFMALFDIFGGNIEQLNQQLVFCNGQNNKIHINFVYQQDFHIYERLVQILEPNYLEASKQKLLKQGKSQKVSKKNQKKEKIKAKAQIMCKRQQRNQVNNNFKVKLQDPNRYEVNNSNTINESKNMQQTAQIQPFIQLIPQPQIKSFVLYQSVEVNDLIYLDNRSQEHCKRTTTKQQTQSAAKGESEPFLQEYRDLKKLFNLIRLQEQQDSFDQDDYFHTTRKKTSTRIINQKENRYMGMTRSSKKNGKVKLQYQQSKQSNDGKQEINQSINLEGYSQHYAWRQVNSNAQGEDFYFQSQDQECKR